MNKNIPQIDPAIAGHANTTSIAAASAAESFKRFEMSLRESRMHKVVMASGGGGMSQQLMPRGAVTPGIATGLLASVLRRL